ncbi:type IV toxin-antitoxin system AbiEi family antitoxin domain-containing protein [Janibacter melonis]|uniref:DUF559 domain-containing protein n=1 Tax=Janibacter melonis TaxID=262209 RepID=UPI00177B689C|nr:DUF559 domain-containing protein [Janibacter melonis]
MRRVDLLSLGGVAVFSAEQAVADGISQRTVRDLVARGRLTRLHHGWYTAVGITDDEHRHRLATVAAVAHLGGRCVASHHSALVLHRLPVHQVDLRRVYLARSDTTHGRVREAVVVRAGRSLRATAFVEGWPRPVGTVAVADACVLSGALHGPSTGLVAADAAVHAGMCTVEDLESAAGRAKGCTGIEAIMAQVRHVDGRHESVGETLTAIALRATGIAFEPQIEIGTDRGTYRVDFLNEELRVVVEFDGLSKYGDVDDLVAEKVREDALRRRGYLVVRVIWRELFEPGAVAGAIAQALAAR